MGDYDLAKDFLQALRNLRISDEMSDREQREITVELVQETQHWRLKSERPTWFSGAAEACCDEP